MFRGTFSNKTIYSAEAEAKNLAREDAPRTTDFIKSNTIWNPLGSESARGWLVMLRRDVEAMDLNVLSDLVLQFQDQENKPPKTTSSSGTDTLTFYNLVVTKEPMCLLPGITMEDPLSVMLVEVSDGRWRCKNPTYSVSINRTYNVRQPAMTGSASPTYCPNSLNGGAAWTWQEMVTDIWNLMQNQLGTESQLPFTPTEPPEGWVFQGMSAWDALTDVLSRLGCAVKWNPFRSNNAHTIVQVGAEDEASDDLLQEAEDQDREIHDGEFLTGVVRGKVPYGVSVFFRRRDESPPASSCDSVTGRAYQIDVVGPDTDDAEPGVYTPIWDDLPAVYVEGILTNLAAMTARAQERADDYFRQIRDPGGERLWKIYSGLLSATPGSTIKAVRHRFTDPVNQDIATEIVNHPFLLFKINDRGDIEPVQPPPPTPPFCPDTGVVVSFLTPPTPTFTIQPLDDICCQYLATLVQPQQKITVDQCGLTSVKPAGVVVQQAAFNICACDEAPSQCITVCDCPEFPCGMPCAWAASYGELADPDHPWGTLDCGTPVNFSVFNKPYMLVYWTSGCEWVSTEPTGLVLTKSTVWQFTFSAGGKTIFFLHDSSALGDGVFNPCGWNLFLLNADLSAPCDVSGSDVPSSIIINPVGVCGPCPDTCECVPGECSECDDNTPFAWDIPISGFTGPCAVFNGVWHLTQTDATTDCQWIFQSGTLTISFERTGGDWVLECEDTAQGVSASFTAPASGDNCCIPITLTKYTCSCASSGGGCSECVSTPAEFTTELAGFAGDLLALNGIRGLVYLGGCEWRGVDANLILHIGGAGSVSLQVAVTGGKGAVYTGTVMSGDCCPSAIVMTFVSFANGATGPAPPSLELVPSCVGGGDDGFCPDQIIATPICCDDDESEGDCDNCSLCPKEVQGSPDIWYLIAPDLADSCCFGSPDNTPLKLFRRTTGDCLWTNESDSRIISLFPQDGTWKIVCLTAGGSIKLVYQLDGFAFRCCFTNRFSLDVLKSEGIGKAGCNAPVSLILSPPPEGCPCTAPPPAGVTTTCCAGIEIPLTLHISSGGTGILGDTTITYDGSVYWTGVAGAGAAFPAAAGDPIRFHCRTTAIDGSDGTTCEDFRLEYQHGGFWHLCATLPATCSCGPPFSFQSTSCGTVTP